LKILRTAQTQANALLTMHHKDFKVCFLFFVFDFSQSAAQRGEVKFRPLRTSLGIPGLGVAVAAGSFGDVLH
jgi:hypothetical protein